ncbi:glycosyltransferase family 2 protein [Longibaculum muris]|uniref:glycosyltransferase family 2 protein n=1 Tax=Longibaculum muris TaxID=1796628 RepID=UPI002943CCC0|nr:glycosyltransferase family 2 protein [Longibaculum muris]
MLLSVIVPCYNEEDNVALFYNEAMHSLEEIIDEVEFVFINDGSKDNTLEELKKIYKTAMVNIKIIDFSRNFGKEAALLAGFENAVGDYVAIIDADLQQNPKYICQMLKILNENSEYDCVAAYQDVRKEGKILSFFKDCFYKLINKMTEVEIVRSASDFRLLKRKVVNAILSLPEKCRFSKGIFSWVGFNTYYMPYTVEERANGTSKWSFWKLFAYAIDGIVAFSTVPLVVASIIGIILFIISILLLLIIVVKTLIWGDPVAGFPTLASLLLLTAGIQLLCIGVLGQYLAKNYTESKERPMYIVKDFYSSKEKQK